MDPDNVNVFVCNLSKEAGITAQDLTEAFVSAGCKFADIVEVTGAGGGGGRPFVFQCNGRWKKRERGK